jgi:hypothetical protein
MRGKLRISAMAVACGAAVATMVGTGAGPAGAIAGAGPNGPRPGGHAMFTVRSWGGNAASVAATTIPTWKGSFTLNSVTYSYKMVGSNPAAGSKTTTVPTEILPLKVVMADGITVTGSATKLKASPIFSNAAFTSGTTQLGDAMMRAGFWSTVSATAPNWHLLLGTPTVLPRVTINVPAADGTGFTFNGIPYANISYSWWATKLQGIITAHNFPATALPLIVSGSTFLYIGSTSNCCVYGYHGAYTSTSGHNTYAFANWIAKGLVANGNADVYTMSHEVSEWAADPFVNNVVPKWDQPGGATCFSDLLEVGDPVEAMAKPWYTINVGTTAYHPSDIAGLSWFAHSSPSTEQNGLYSYKGYLSAPSILC